MQRKNVSRLRLSTRGAVVLAASEGVVPAVYLDSRDIPTFGVGVTHWAVGQETFNQFNDRMPDDIDAVVDWVLDLFPEVAAKYEQFVRNNVSVPLYQHEYDALVHFVYNVGEPNFQQSKLLGWLNAGDYATAGQRGFHGWLKPKSLEGRRDVERALFLHGDYGRKDVPIWGTDGKRNLRGVIRTISHERALEMMDWGAGDTSEGRSITYEYHGDPDPAARPDVSEMVKLAPLPSPRAGTGPAVKELIDETARGGAKSKTNWVMAALGLFTGGGSLSAALEAVDPKIVLMVVAGAVLLGAVYVVSSRGRKSKKGLAAQREVAVDRAQEIMGELGLTADDVTSLISAVGHGLAR